jgi:hypothetical protein
MALFFQNGIFYGDENKKIQKNSKKLSKKY